MFTFRVQDGNALHIKVAEVIPKFTFLGKNLDEALNLQKQHEDLLLNIQVDRINDLLIQKKGKPAFFSKMED